MILYKCYNQGIANICWGNLRNYCWDNNLLRFDYVQQEYNGEFCMINGEQYVQFDNDQDYTFFILRWS